MTILRTSSPYWLRVDGVWVHAEGVAPGVQRTAERPASSFVTVGGVRHSQQARRAARSWSWSLSWATAEALRLLSVAAESDDVWLADVSASRENMLAPWATQGTRGVAVLADGVPLKPLAVGAGASVPVRPGVEVRVAVWTAAAAGVPVVSVAHPGGSGNLLAPAGSGMRRTADLAFTPATAGVLSTTVLAGAGSVTTALHVYEGEVALSRWLAGQRSPCRVRVGDVESELAMVRAGVGYSMASVTIEEVG